MRIRIVFVVLLAVVSMTSTAGDSHAAVLNNASLNGVYYVVDFGYYQNAGPSSEFDAITFDGNGNWVGTWTSYRYIGSQSGSFSGTYSVNASGAVTVTPTGLSPVLGQYLSADGKAMLNARTDYGIYPAIGVWMKAGTSGFSNASLNGVYNGVAFVFDRNLGPHSELDTIIFDGNGNWTGTMGMQGYSYYGKYSVNASGAVTVTVGPTEPSPGSGFYLSADGNTIISTINDTTALIISVWVKAGTGAFSNASLNGIYNCVAFGFDQNSGPHSELDTITFDGNGNWTGTGMSAQYLGIQSGNISGTYSVDAVGTVIITPSGQSSLSGHLSADGNTIIDTRNSATDPAIGVWVKGSIWQSIPGAISSSPALAWNPVSNKIQMVVQGSGDTIWSSTFDSSGTFNDDWTRIPGAIMSPPALAWNPVSNKMQMVVQGSGNTIWASTFSSTGDFNDDWTLIPGAIMSPPALAWNPVSNKMQMVVRGSSDTIWSSTLDSSGTFNSDWTQIPGAIISTPALAWNPASNKMQMVVQGNGDTIWSSTFNSNGTFNSDWCAIPGTIFSPPTLALDPVGGNIKLVVRGTGDTIWFATFSSYGMFNSDWIQLPGAITDQPAIVWNPVKGNLLIVVRGTNNTILTLAH